MSDNPFASYQVEVPKKYSDQIKSYCKTGGGKVSYEFAPFERQVDFWYFAFLYAVNKQLNPDETGERSNITPASIFTSDPYRISHIQLAYLAEFENIELLSNYKKVMGYANNMACAGTPYLLQLLGDEDDRPLWALLDEISLPK